MSALDEFEARLIEIISKKTIEELERLQESKDFEKAHVEADKLLCTLLVGLGFSKVVEAWEKVPRWYA